MIASDRKILNKILKTLDYEENEILYERIRELSSQDPDPFSDLNIADMLHTACMTESIPKDLAGLIIKYYLKAARDEKTRAVAYNNLGALYYSGRTGSRDYQKAAEYYEKSAHEGYAVANENLAYIYYYGQGTEVDYEKAYYYFSRAALLGRCEATYRIGDMFRYGRYVSKDENMTRESYIRAEELLRKDYMSFDTVTGDVYKRLGDLFYEGIGIDKDPDRAYECYQRSERGYYEQIRCGNQYVEESLKAVYDRIDELKKVIRADLPTLEWTKI